TGCPGRLDEEIDIRARAVRHNMVVKVSGQGVPVVVPSKLHRTSLIGTETVVHPPRRPGHPQNGTRSTTCLRRRTPSPPAAPAPAGPPRGATHSAPPPCAPPASAPGGRQRPRPAGDPPACLPASGFVPALPPSDSRLSGTSSRARGGSSFWSVVPAGRPAGG